MKRKLLILLVVIAGFGLSLALLYVTAGYSRPTWAAAHSDHLANVPLSSELYRNDPLRLLEQEPISCTLAITTTDDGLDNNTRENAVTLIDRTGLELIDLEGDDKDGSGHSRWSESDFFELDVGNDQIGLTYQVSVEPDTDNYNLGLAVYYEDETEALEIDDDPVDDESASVSLMPETRGTYYFEVFQITNHDACRGGTYDLDVEISGVPWDAYEPNNNIGDAYDASGLWNTTSASATAPDINFYPYQGEEPDEDWFSFWAKGGRTYKVTTSDLVGALDTDLVIFNTNSVTVATDSSSGYESEAEFIPSQDAYYYIRVKNKITSDPNPNHTYTLDINEIVEETPTPSPTKTPTPGPTPRAQADDCEDNSTFERACVIPVNQSQTFNLVPPFKGTDNDFYRIWVKPGLHFRCATSDLSAGVDPNMIMFTAPSWDNAIGGNDDIEPGNYNSAMTHYATYSGWLYVLVGTGDRTPSDVYNSEYTLTCEVQVPGTSTPEPTRTPEPTHTPDGAGPTPTTSGSPVATPTPSQALTVRPMTTPTPAPDTTPSPRFIPISLVVYYDGNNDLQPGAGEGIAGISAQAYEVATNQLLAQGFTDEQGNLEFTVAAQGPVRLSIPFLDFSQLVTGEGASIYLRIPPRSLPGGAP